MDTKTIVLLLAAVLISVISKYYENKMKKQQKQKSQTPDSHEESSMEEVLRKFLSDDPVEQTEQSELDPTSEQKAITPQAQSLEGQSLELPKEEPQSLETLHSKELEGGESIYEQWQKGRSSTAFVSSYSMIESSPQSEIVDASKEQSPKISQEPTEQPCFAETLKGNISLREAVIYSEILNRKYS